MFRVEGLRGFGCGVRRLQVFRVCSRVQGFGGYEGV